MCVCDVDACDVMHVACCMLHVVSVFSAHERADIAAARQYFYDTRDARGAMQKMPVCVHTRMAVL